MAIKRFPDPAMLIDKIPYVISRAVALRRTSVFLGTVIILATIIRIVCFQGLVGGEDLSFIDAARSISLNNFDVSSLEYIGKLGYVLPLALSFKLFGANEWAQLSISLLASVGTVCVAFGVGWYSYAISGRRNYGDLAGYIAAAAIAINPLEIAFATRIAPYALFSFFFALATGIAYLSYKHNRNVSIFVAAAAGVTSYFIHEWGLVLLVFWTLAFLILAILKKVPFWYPIVWFAATVLVIPLESFIWYLLAGDPYFAWTVYFNADSVIRPETAGLISRFGREFIGLAYWELGGSGIITALGITSAIFLLLRRRWSETVLIVWIGALFIWANFAPASLLVYSPHPAVNWILLPVIFPLCILIGRAGTQLLVEPNAERALQRWVGATAVSSFFAMMAVDGSRGNPLITFVIYIALLIVPPVALGIIRRIKTKNRDLYANLAIMFIGVITIGLLSVPTIYVKFHPNKWVGNQREIIEYAEENSIKTIITDPRSKGSLEYLNGYNDDVTFLDYYDPNVKPRRGDVVIVDHYSLWRSSIYNRPVSPYFDDMKSFEQKKIIFASPQPAFIYEVR